MRHVLIVLILSAIVLLPGLGKITLTEHEVFAAEPAREMLAGGPVAYQQFAGQPRLQKPPGQSWLIAASVAVFGQTDFAARLPSAIAGALAAVAATLIGTWAAGRRTGLIAGLMLLTCVGVQQRTHLAEADMALAAAVAVANAAVVRAILSGPSPSGGGWVGAGSGESQSGALLRSIPSPNLSPRERDRIGGGVVFWAAVVAGFLLKGPIVLGFTVLPAVVCWAVLRFGFKDRRGSSIACGPLWWPLIVLGMLAIAAWVVAALHAMPFPVREAIDHWKHEIGDRVAGGIRRDPIVSYAWLVPQATLPWVVFAFAAIGPLVQRRLWREPVALFLICWGVCGAAMVTAIAFKRMHYALPMLLPVIVLSAVGFDRVLQATVRRFDQKKRPSVRTAALVGWFGLASAGWLVNWIKIAPGLDTGRPVTDFAAAVNANVPPGEPVYLVQVGQDRAAWYVRREPRGVAEMPAAGGYAVVKQIDSDDLLCERGGRVIATAEPYNPPGRHDEDEREGERRLLVRVPASQP